MPCDVDVCRCIWFKQQGAVFAIAALVFLTWRSGFKKAWAYWLISIGLGAGLYIAMPNWILGSRFHYFTWEVPRQWVEIQYWDVIRFLKLILFSYPVLAGVSLIVVLTQVQKLRHNIWYFMFPIAGLSGILATMTPGSNNNVYIPMGTWFIVVGVIALDRMMPRLKQFGLHFFAIALSFALFAYNPMSVVVSGQSQMIYQDFVSYLEGLPGTVYAPWIGQLQDRKIFSPSLHWVPLDDLVRGKNPDPTKHPPLEKLLQSVVQPKGKAYLLHNLPLEQDGRLSFLQQNYKLEADLGTRFRALKTLPKHYTLDYPRYLYRHISK